MKKFIRVVLILFILGTFGGTLYYLYQKNQEKPFVYTTDSPFKTDIVKKTVATGSVKPRKEIEIKPTITGIIDKLYVEPGNVVKKGDLIAKVRIIPDMVSLNNAESRVNRAKYALENAQADYERNKKLLNDGVIAIATFQPIELALKNAQEELEAAENNLLLIKEGITKSTNQTSNTLIRSTANGMVLDVPVEEGNSVIEANNFNAGTTIAFIAEMNDMIFEGKVDESEVGKVKEGMPLVLTIGALENQTFDAALEYISPKGVEENGAIQFGIRAAINLSENMFLRAGYSANADIVLDKRDSVLAIKESLIEFSGDTAFVEVEITDQQFEKKEIQLGLSDGINVEILNGVTESDKLKSGKKEL